MKSIKAFVNSLFGSRLIEFGDTYRNCYDILMQFNKTNPHLAHKYVVYPLINPEISDDEFAPSIIMERDDAYHMEQYRKSCLERHRRLPLYTIIDEEILFINNRFKNKYRTACQQANGIPISEGSRTLTLF